MVSVPEVARYEFDEGYSDEEAYPNSIDRSSPTV